MQAKLSSLSAVIPAYNDEESLPILTQKLLQILPNFARRYELIIVNDASSDSTLQVAYAIATTSPVIRIINHKRNKGYGGALLSGFKKARHAYIFYTDGDGQHDVFELKKLIANIGRKTDMVTGFRLARSDPWFRKSVGFLYNSFVKTALGLRVCDVDCDFRLFKRSILKGVVLKSKSGAFDAEFIKKLQDKGVRIREVGVHHYPRLYGSSQFFHVRPVIKSLFELALLLVKK